VELLEIVGAPGDAGEVVDAPGVADVFEAPGIVIEVVDALALGSSFAFAKRAPPRTIAPAAATAMNGSFLLLLRSTGAFSSPSDNSNHSGFSEVIVDPFQLPKP
jgi:hypothetical protein